MIGVEDKEQLFRLIADYIEKDVECVAIGGTAMMFLGYKATTKDIDLVFKNKKDREVFCSAIEKLGYLRKSARFVYEAKKLNQRTMPLLYSRSDERFDLFAMDVFGYKLNFDNFLQRHDYIGKRELIIFTAPKEELVILKAVTNRDKDYEDIEIIAKTENPDWGRIVDMAIARREQMPWILIDLEEKMQKLKKVTFIKKEVFEKLYKAERNAQK